MPHCSQGQLSYQMSLLRKQFFQSSESGEAPFAEVFSAERVQEAIHREGFRFRERMFTPLVTLWTFLVQVLSADQSCRAAVAWLVAFCQSRGEKPPSSRTGAYCMARGRLPESLLARLVRETGGELHRQVQEGWRWLGRSVKLFDGSTVSMPDTPENQAAYPQHGKQKAGVGFPLARIGVLFSLGCGAALDLAVCAFRGKGQSELGLLRRVWHHLQSEDVLLVDRYLCSWFEIALLKQRGIDVVTRLHAQRRADFRRGRKLGREDHLVHWPKPARRPEWLDEQQYRQLPAYLEIREVRVHVQRPGFRTRQMVVVTTLTDAEAVSRDDLADVYRMRWHAELDLRALKQTLQMDILRGKTPEIVRKELWMHLLGYNLIRTLMARAAERHGVLPRCLSFKGALQTTLAFAAAARMGPESHLEPLLSGLLDAIVCHQVGHRPDRIEPRKRKRRQKTYPLLTEPRTKARSRLLKGSNA